VTKKSERRPAEFHTHSFCPAGSHIGHRGFSAFEIFHFFFLLFSFLFDQKCVCETGGETKKTKDRVAKLMIIWLCGSLRRHLSTKNACGCALAMFIQEK
jgi:hypothetical protein